MLRVFAFSSFMGGCYSEPSKGARGSGNDDAAQRADSEASGMSGRQNHQEINELLFTSQYVLLIVIIT